MGCVISSPRQLTLPVRAPSTLFSTLWLQVDKCGTVVLKEEQPTPDCGWRRAAKEGSWTFRGFCVREISRLCVKPLRF